MKYAIYTRSSTTEQKPTENQQEKIIRKSLNKSDKVCGVYSDEGISGNTLNRPALNKLRSAAKKGAFEGICVTDPARLSRSMSDYAILMNEFSKKRINLKFLSPEISDAVETFNWNILSAIAEFDRRIISERIKKGLRARILKKK